jgi:hypothetical protein
VKCLWRAAGDVLHSLHRQADRHTASYRTRRDYEHHQDCNLILSFFFHKFTVSVKLRDDLHAVLSDLIFEVPISNLGLKTGSSS